MDYTFGDFCRNLDELMQLDFDVNLDSGVYKQVWDSIVARYVIACNQNHKFADQDLMRQAHDIARQRKFGPF